MVAFSVPSFLSYWLKAEQGGNVPGRRGNSFLFIFPSLVGPPVMDGR